MGPRACINIGGIEKFNSDLLNSIVKSNHQVILVERRPGYLFEKITYLTYKNSVCDDISLLMKFMLKLIQIKNNLKIIL